MNQGANLLSSSTSKLKMLSMNFIFGNISIPTVSKTVRTSSAQSSSKHDQAFRQVGMI